jgi:hypothetical protein
MSSSKVARVLPLISTPTTFNGLTNGSVEGGKSTFKWSNLSTDVLDMIWSLISTREQLTNITCVCHRWNTLNKSGLAGWNSNQVFDISLYRLAESPPGWVSLLRHVWRHVRSLVLILGESVDGPDIIHSLPRVFDDHHFTLIQQLYLQCTHALRSADKIIQILSLSQHLTWLTLSSLYSDDIPLLVPQLARTRVKRLEFFSLLPPRSRVSDTQQENPSTVKEMISLLLSLCSLIRPQRHLDASSGGQCNVNDLVHFGIDRYPNDLLSLITQLTSFSILDNPPKLSCELITSLVRNGTLPLLQQCYLPPYQNPFTRQQIIDGDMLTISDDSSYSSLGPRNYRHLSGIKTLRQAGTTDGRGGAINWRSMHAQDVHRYISSSRVSPSLSSSPLSLSSHIAILNSIFSFIHHSRKWYSIESICRTWLHASKVKVVDSDRLSCHKVSFPMVVKNHGHGILSMVHHVSNDCVILKLVHIIIIITI